MSGDAKWGDLPARILSAVIMLAVGVEGLWLGGLWFHGLVALICAGMIWELTRIMGTKAASDGIWLGALCGVIIFFSHLIPPFFLLPVLIAPALTGASRLSKDHAIFVAYAAGLMVACYGLVKLRDFNGLPSVAWLVLVVIATDIAGYFAGRTFGGPKFWPSISPKKTWSGTSAGWVAAAVVGLAFGGWKLMLISVLTSFASQMGDIAESAIKRRYGVKDSSHLIPGHGGLLDRFDAMMGAALFVMILSLVIALPQAG
ncbi:phosphatidate cytidylyltransferase [Shimia biformata]|uniref:phosphatidate cytidylyltransferase n=1 Tax=Shimia biformata TaxID=1294299 RepID=UPI00194F5B8F|nr:phosphatidate cytidylyltransferase [Shimia biformata]